MRKIAVLKLSVKLGYGPVTLSCKFLFLVWMEVKYVKRILRNYTLTWCWVCNIDGKISLVKELISKNGSNAACERTGTGDTTAGTIQGCRLLPKHFVCNKWTAQAALWGCAPSPGLRTHPCLCSCNGPIGRWTHSPAASILPQGWGQHRSSTSLLPGSASHSCLTHQDR